MYALGRILPDSNESTSTHRFTVPAYEISLSSVTYVVLDMMLTCDLQASPDALGYTPDACNGGTFSCLCSLLQALPSLHTDTNIRYYSCHIAWSDSAPRSLLFDPSSIDCHPQRGPLRSVIFIFTVHLGDPRLKYPSPTSNKPGNRVLFRPYSPTEVFSTASTTSFAFFTSSKWSYNYSL
jgi:hypothetical protein